MVLIVEVALRASPIGFQFRKQIEELGNPNLLGYLADSQIGYRPPWEEFGSPYSSQGIYLPSSTSPSGEFLVLGNERTRYGEWLKELGEVTGLSWSNGAVDGYSLGQQLQYGKEMTERLKPKWVVWFIRPEDLVVSPRIVASVNPKEALLVHGKQAPRRIPISWIARSYLFGLYWENLFEEMDFSSSLRQQIEEEGETLRQILQSSNSIRADRLTLVFTKYDLAEPRSREWRFQEAERLLKRISAEAAGKKGMKVSLNCLDVNNSAPAMKTCLRQAR
jgi:hypothetical protein